MGVLLAAAILLASGCATTAAETAQGRWYEVRSPRFRVWTDGDVKHAWSLALDLERFHQILVAKTTAEEREAAPPLRIFLAKDRHSYAAWTGDNRTAGVFVATSRGNYALAATQRASGGWTQDSRHVLFHEYTHYVMAMQGANVPSWYNEGFADYMSATRFREDGSYTLGCPLLYHTQMTAARRWLPMSRVIEADNILHGSAQAPFDERQASAAYRQSWYAVHFFNARSDRQAQLAQYLLTWASGTTTPEDALRSAFNLDYVQLDAQLQDYARRSKLQCVAIHPAQQLASPQIEVRPLSRAEAHLHVGDLLLAKYGPTDAALALLHEAAALAPRDARPLAALARAEVMTAQNAQDGAAAQGALKRAEELLAQAQTIAADPEPETLAIDGHVQRLTAELATARGEAVAAAAALERARASYRRAIRRDETIAEAYYGLGATYLIEDNGSKEAQVVLEAAAYLLPLDTNVAWTLAQLHIARGNSLQAIPALEHVLRWSKDDASRAKVTAAIHDLREGSAAEPAPAAAPDAAAPTGGAAGKAEGEGPDAGGAR